MHYSRLGESKLLIGLESEECIRHAPGRFVKIWTIDSQGTADTLLQVRRHHTSCVISPRRQQSITLARGSEPSGVRAHGTRCSFPSASARGLRFGMACSE